jgi:hypothetical protein
MQSQELVEQRLIGVLLFRGEAVNGDQGRFGPQRPGVAKNSAYATTLSRGSSFGLVRLSHDATVAGDNGESLPRARASAAWVSLQSCHCSVRRYRSRSTSSRSAGGAGCTTGHLQQHRRLGQEHTGLLSQIQLFPGSILNST